MNSEKPPPWHALSAGETLARLGTDPALGLSPREARLRLERFGPNEIAGSEAPSPWRILWGQLRSTMVLILAAAAVLSAAIGDLKDAAAVAAILLLNIALGFGQEHRAERSIAALKRLDVPWIRTRRGGESVAVSARELVPGDVVDLEAGALVPADGRLLEAVHLRLQEGALTGESEPVEKEAGRLSEPRAPLGERPGMVYRGTLVVHGRGRAVVVESGMRTELGRVATLLEATRRSPTPLQQRFDHLGGRLALAALGVAAVVFLAGLLRGEAPKTLFLTAVSLAVAAVPEGLPAMVTIVLALGAQRMLKRRALIRKLPAVETLGSVTVICSDKTGTVTEGRMSVAALHAGGARLDLPPAANLADAEPRLQRRLQDHPPLAALFAGAALCNDATLERSGESWRGLGDPTEAALLAAAARHGLPPHALRPALPRVAELAFDSSRKRMTTVHRLRAELLPPVLQSLGEAPYLCFTKGSVDALLGISDFVLIGAHTLPLDEDRRRLILEANAELAKEGMRVLAVAMRGMPELPDPLSGPAAERALTFLGLAALRDPPRAEARSAVRRCRGAGIRPILITGDHPLTAQAIARLVGIPASEVLTGAALERLSPEELGRRAESVSVFARVAPEHKLLIVSALQERGHRVAMTGDGVNDAPALKKADIGVAMGAAGTDAAKEAADMVLLDDNFATIVAAVEEGRALYDNIRKFMKYLITTNSAELLVMLAAPLFGMPLPLSPIQILWMNLVSDGPPALALGTERGERRLMRAPPRPSGEGLLSGGLGLHAALIGLVMTLGALGLGFAYWRRGRPEWQTLLFCSLVFSQMGHVLAVRSETRSVLGRGLWGNPWLLLAVGATLALQLAVVYLPALRPVFSTHPLGAEGLLLASAAAAAVLGCVEAEKAFKRRRKRSDAAKKRRASRSGNGSSE